MELSLFNLGTRADPAINHAQVLEQMRTMVCMADQAGFDIAWFAEHHLSSYSITPSPLVTTALFPSGLTAMSIGSGNEELGSSSRTWSTVPSGPNTPRP